MSFVGFTEIWTYCTQRDVVWDHHRNLNLLTKRDVAWEHYRRFNLFQSTIWRLRALQKSEHIALNEMSFESITEIWTYCINDISFESITEIWTYCTQRDVVCEHYRDMNVLHSTMCHLRALQKSELIALNEMSFESITEIWSYCSEIHVMSFESITAIWTYCTQRDVAWEHYRNLNLWHSTRYRLRASQKSELIALNEMSFEIIAEIWTYWLNEMSLESITEGLTYFNQRYDVWEHYRNLNVLHSTMCPLRALQQSGLIALNGM